MVGQAQPFKCWKRKEKKGGSFLHTSVENPSLLSLVHVFQWRQIFYLVPCADRVVGLVDTDKDQGRFLVLGVKGLGAGIFVLIVTADVWQIAVVDGFAFECSELVLSPPQQRVLLLVVLDRGHGGDGTMNVDAKRDEMDHPFLNGEYVCAGPLSHTHNGSRF